MTLVGYASAERMASSSFSRSSEEWEEVPADSGRAIALDIPLQAAETATQGMVMVPGGTYNLVGPVETDDGGCARMLNLAGMRNRLHELLAEFFE